MKIQVLSQSAIGQLVLTLPDGGPTVRVSLPRIAPPPDLVVPFGSPHPQAVSGTSHKQIELVGEPGTLTLHATLGNPIGRGRSSVVFSLENVRLDSGLSPDVKVPSFVIKVERPNRCASLAREAWFYEKLAPLQGVAIPWCYGWFESEVASGSEEHKWKTQSLRIIENTLDDAAINRKGLSNSDHPHKWLWSRCYNPDLFSCLLLERLGEVLPGGRELPDDVKNDIEGICEDICSFGVQVCDDIHQNNILKATECLPSLPSSRTGQCHGWRLVDLELARMPKAEVKQLHNNCLYALRRTVYPEVAKPIVKSPVYQQKPSEGLPLPKTAFGKRRELKKPGRT